MVTGAVAGGWIGSVRSVIAKCAGLCQGPALLDGLGDLGEVGRAKGGGGYKSGMFEGRRADAVGWAGRKGGGEMGRVRGWAGDGPRS